MVYFDSRELTDAVKVGLALNFQEIESFLAIAEKQNFSRAASSLYISQSTLSHRIGALELELNVVLFERKRGQRLAVLTNEGNAFLQIAERWVALYKETQNLQLINSTQNLLVSAVPSLNNFLFPPLFHRIFTEAPGLRLMLRGSQSATLYTALERHSIDVGFAVLEAPYSSINSLSLFSEEHLLALPSPCPVERGQLGPDVHPSELDPERELLYIYHPNYQHWHASWYGYFSQPLIGLADASSMLDRFLGTPNTWCIMPKSVALAVQGSCNVSLHRLTAPPPDRVCYMLTHGLLQSRKEKSFAIFKQYLDEFLTQSEASGLITRLG